MKIIKLPHIVRYHAKVFKPIFRNQGQYKHFKEYLTGLMINENKTLDSIQSQFFNSTSTNSLDHFMIHSEWQEDAMNHQRILDLQNRPETTSMPSGVICIDDTYNEKSGQQIDNVEWHYDHSQKKMILGHNIVTTQYKDSRVSYALDYRPYHRKPKMEELQKAYEQLDKQIDLFEPTRYYFEKLKLLFRFHYRQRRFKTKIELAIQLIQEAEAVPIKAKTYVFDSWFLSKQLVQVIASYGKDWISVLKPNRLLTIANRKIAVSDYIKTIPKNAYRQIKTKQGNQYWVFTKTVFVSQLGRVRIVISYDNSALKRDPMILITNRKDWEPIKILNTYALRGSIDAFYRDVKQHLGLEDYQLRTMRGIERHWYFVFLAHSFLMLNMLRSKLIKRFRTRLTTIGQCSRAMADELSVSLILWIYKQFQNHRSADNVIQCLLE